MHIESCSLVSLQHIDLFKGLATDELSCNVTGEVRTVVKGEQLFYEGDAATTFIVIVSGAFQVYRIVREQRILINEFGTGSTAGEVPLLCGTPHLGNGVVTERGEFLFISAEDFWDMMGDCPTVRQRVLVNMADRMQQLTMMSAQREKMAALGTMAAGLAHELNNPAAAAKRSADLLIETLSDFDKHSSNLVRKALFNVTDHDPFQPLSRMNPDSFRSKSALERQDIENDLCDWVQELGIDEADMVSSSLAASGATVEILTEITSVMDPAFHQDFICWLMYEFEMKGLSSDIHLASNKIVELIEALKRYSHMDRTMDRQDVNIQQGIRDTAAILNHKLKSKNITLTTSFAPDIVTVKGYTTELNQVWTNLIDNAIDAVPQAGHIEISTEWATPEKDFVFIRIADNGTGIPKSIANKIFEPFFTTKAIGKGTGIGLEMVYRIVVNQHNGKVTVESVPGNTVFTVCLPVL